MFKPSTDQINFEISRLDAITYDIVYKHFKIIQNRITRLRRLIINTPPSYQARLELLERFNCIVEKFNKYCHQAGATPQSY